MYRIFNTVSNKIDDLLNDSSNSSRQRRKIEQCHQNVQNLDKKRKWHALPFHILSKNHDLVNLDDTNEKQQEQNLQDFDTEKKQHGEDKTPDDAEANDREKALPLIILLAPLKEKLVRRVLTGTEKYHIHIYIP